MGKETFLCPCFFLVSSTSPQACVKLMFLDGFKQSDRLQGIATGVGTGFLLGRAPVDGILHRTNYQPSTQFLHKVVAKLHRFRKVVPRVHVNKGKRHLGRGKSLDRKMSHHNGILASGKQQRRAFELGRRLTHDENGFRLQLLEMREVVGLHGKQAGVQEEAGRRRGSAADHNCSRVSRGLNFSVSKTSQGFSGSLKVDCRPVKSRISPALALA